MVGTSADTIQNYRFPTPKLAVEASAISIRIQQHVLCKAHPVA
ncbi:MAG: hypothetical protein ACLR23_02540 [Clostridia bacterium]